MAIVQGFAAAKIKRSGTDMQKLSRKQLKEALNNVPMVQILGGSPELTHKQKEFARLVASGETGASAYRKAYNSKGKPKTQGDHASRLKADDRVKAEIEAYKAANAALAYQTPQQLRQLVIHSLVKVMTNPDAKEATVVQAAKVLGTVTEVAAFTERKEVTHVKTSEDARAHLMAKLREVVSGDVEDVKIKDSADSLAQELILSSSDGNVTSKTSHDVNVTTSDNDAMHDAQDSTPPVNDSAERDNATPTAPIGVRSPSIPIHTIPHTQSQQKSIPTPPPDNSADSLEAELLGNTPPSKTK
jgi:predicted house-cleaning noncanonical NTP pyrophosphatase (MazG superfamily)